MKSRKAAEYAEEVKAELGDGWIPRIYRNSILTVRTRSYQFQPPSKGAAVVVQHTLLGVELKIGRTRRLCPDLSTARYLAVFARLGCTAVAVPYDITKLSEYADSLESSWQRMLILVDHLAFGRGAAFRSRIKGLIVNEIRTDILDAGPGSAIPKFNQSTRQRKR